MIDNIELLFRYKFLHTFYDVYSRISKNFYFNSIPLRRNSENHVPFFIVGSGRSGNTLLRRILTAKEGIVIPPETYVLGKIIRLHKTHKNLIWDDYVNLMLSTFEYHNQFFTFEIDSLSKLALDLKEIKPGNRSLAQIVNQFYFFYAQQKGLKLTRWGDKTPLNALYVYRIKKLFPKAQFIHIIRDGVDVTYSYVNSGLYNDYYTAARLWKNSVSFLRKFGKKNPANYYEIKYEALVNEPERVVKGLCRFLNIEYHKQMVHSKEGIDDLGDVRFLEHHKNIYKNISSNYIGKGRRNLSHDNLKKIAPVINKTLDDFDYEIIGV